MTTKVQRMKRILTCISIIGIGFGITLILVFGNGSGSDGQNTSVVDNTETQQRRLPRLAQDTSINRQEKVTHDLDDFYRVIIKNNIFRPLNYEPPPQKPDLILIGTIIATDKSTAIAYITERQTKRSYSVKEGEKIGNAIVKTIQPKQVTLDKGGKIVSLTLSSTPFISRPRSRQSSTYTPSLPSPQVVSERQRAQNPSKNANDKERKTWREMQKERIAELKKESEKLKEIAAKQRQRMLEYNQK